MIGSIIVVGFFILGCLLGWAGLLPDWIMDADLSMYVLYALMFQVGLSIGSDKKLKDILQSIRPKLLLVPLATISGSLLFAALISLVISRWSVFDCLALGSGFAYYSLSSLLIVQLKEASAGIEIASQLGAIALLANIIREMLALFGAPLYASFFGKFAPVSVAGINSMDVCLPVISRYSGKNIVPVAIIHGIILEISVPLLISLFCK